MQTLSSAAFRSRLETLSAPTRPALAPPQDAPPQTTDKPPQDTPPPQTTDKPPLDNPPFPSKPTTVYNTVKQLVAGAADTATDTVDLGFGIDPNLSTLTALSTVSNAFTATGLVPHGAADLFGNYCYPAYRGVAFGLDALKLANTYKTSVAVGHLSDPNATGLKAVKASGNWFNLAVDTAHLALDVAIGVSLAGAALHYPMLMSPQLAMGLGFAGDVVAGVVHGAGAAASLSNSQNGSTFAKRWEKLHDTQGISAVYQRVFLGKEPLDHTPGPSIPVPTSTQPPPTVARPA